jgi:hypothetical protein
VAETLAVLVGGGPAPGINGVIASAAMEAFKCGLRAVGIYDGYRDLASGAPPKTIELNFDRVSGATIRRTAPQRLPSAYAGESASRPFRRRSTTICRFPTMRRPSGSKPRVRSAPEFSKA